jgi:hypothetical protein
MMMMMMRMMMTMDTNKDEPLSGELLEVELVAFVVVRTYGLLINIP